MTDDDLVEVGLGTVNVSSVRVSLEEIKDSDCFDIYQYWDSLRGDRFAPAWEDFDLSGLPSNCIRYTHVVDISHDPFDVTFRFWGTGLTDVLYFDRTGLSLLSTNMGYLNERRREQVLSDYRTVIDSRSPMPFLWDASSSREYAQRLIVPSIRLPLSADNEHVHNIVTHFDFAHQKSTTWEDMFEVKNRVSKS